MLQLNKGVIYLGKIIHGKTQSNNTLRNVYLTYCGLTLTLAEWSRKLKVNRNTLKWRYRRGYTDKECLFGKEVKANGKN